MGHGKENMEKNFINRRIDHINKLKDSLINNSGKITNQHIKSITRVIRILEFISNTEYTKLLKSFKESHKDYFLELTQFLIDDRVWWKITNRRRTDFENIKKWYLQKDGSDFKIEEYIYLLEQNSSNKKRSGSNEYLDYLNNKKSYNKQYSNKN